MSQGVDLSAYLVCRGIQDVLIGVVVLLIGRRSRRLPYSLASALAEQVAPSTQDDSRIAVRDPQLALGAGLETTRLD